MTADRPRAGYFEETLVLACVGSLASWASRVVGTFHPIFDDADLRSAIQVGGTIFGALVAKWLRDCMGRPLILPLARRNGRNGDDGGAGAAGSASTVALAIILALALSGAGCAWQIGTVTAPAIDANGNPVAGAPPVECKGVTVALGNAGVGETCAAGGELSELGASFLGQVLSPFAWLARIAAAPGA